MPIMLHCLDVLWDNGFILYRECSKKHRSVVDKKSILDHKNFLKRLVYCFKRRAELFRLANMEKKPAAAVVAKNKSSGSRKHVRSLRLNGKNLEQKYGNRTECTSNGEQKGQSDCKYCSHLHLKDKNVDKKPEKECHKVCRPCWWCPQCKVQLCPGKCFDRFHER